jgi:predicted ester cyclase
MLKVRENLSFLIPVIIFWILLGIMTGCEKAKIEKNKVIIEHWLELWNMGDLAIADEILATDFVSHIAQYPDVNDLENYKREVIKTSTDIPDFHAVLEDMVAEDNKVTGRFTATGTMHPAGVKYTNTWITIFRLDGGKIVEQWWHFDVLGVMQQLGIMPSISGGPPALKRAAYEDFIWSEPSDVTGNPGDPEANKDLVLREFEAWNQGDTDELITVLDEIYSAEFIYHDPSRPHVTDLTSYKQWAVEECLVPFPDLYMPVEDIIAEGDKVVVRWTFTGTSEAFGKQITQTGITIYRIADQRIVEAWCACDMLGTIQQIGIIPPMELGGE